MNHRFWIEFTENHTSISFTTTISYCSTVVACFCSKICWICLCTRPVFGAVVTEFIQQLGVYEIISRDSTRNAERHGIRHVFHRCEGCGVGLSANWIHGCTGRINRVHLLLITDWEMLTEVNTKARVNTVRQLFLNARFQVIRTLDEVAGWMLMLIKMRWDLLCYLNEQVREGLMSFAHTPFSLCYVFICICLPCVVLVTVSLT